MVSVERLQATENKLQALEDAVAAQSTEGVRLGLRVEQIARDLGGEGARFSDTVAAKFAQLEAKSGQLLADLEVSFQAHRQALELTHQRLLRTQEEMEAYGKKVTGEFSEHKNAIEVTHGRMQEVISRSGGLEAAVGGLEGRIAAVEAGGGGGAGNGSKEGVGGFKGYLPVKNLVPANLTKIEEWKKWHDDTLDYFDTIKPGMKGLLKRVEKQTDLRDQQWRMQIQVEMGSNIFDESITIWRALKAMTAGDARDVVMAVQEENGFEAWRELNTFYKPSLNAQQGKVLADFGNLVLHPAKTPSETRQKLLEFEKRRQMVEEIIGMRVDDLHAKTVLISIIDKETKKHTIEKQGVGFSCEDYKRDILKFINSVESTDSSTPMQLGSMEGAGDGWHWETPDFEGQLGALNGGKGGGKGGACFNCGRNGQYAGECTEPGGCCGWIL